MNKVWIAAIVLAGLCACDRDTSPNSPNSPNPAGRPSARNPSTLPGQSRDSAASSESREPQQVAQLTFEDVDTNKDGVITPNEALAIPGLDFTSADKDNSHTLSRQEFAAAMAAIRSGPGG